MSVIDLRTSIAEEMSLLLHGPASDGRGWYRTDEERNACFARADAVLVLLRQELAVQREEIAQALESAGTLDGERWQDKAAAIARQHGQG